MNSKSLSPLDQPPLIELLEERIAPATYFAGIGADSPANTSFANYTPTANHATTAMVSTQTGDSSIQTLFTPAATDHYYLVLQSGDTLMLATDNISGYNPFVSVTSGEALAFFFDKNGDFIVDADELTGIAMGEKATVDVGGSVDGDVVANYLGTDSITALSLDSLISDTQSISGLSVNGGVNGRVIAGGSIANVTIANAVHQINTGTAALVGNNGAGFYTYDFGGTGAGAGVGESEINHYYLNDPLSLTPVAKKAGPSITNVRVGALDNPNDANGYGAIIASNGGASAAGGSLINITITNDGTGFSILGGNGGDGTAASINSGAGGKVSTVYVWGVADGNLNQEAIIKGGDGGLAYSAVGVAGAAGNGGGVDKAYVGYKLGLDGKTIVLSDLLIADNVSIMGGDGGIGKKAGAGGSVVDIRIATSTTDDAGELYELKVLGGQGGDSFNLIGATAGAGGGISNAQVRNFYALDSDTGIQVLAGSGGDNVGLQGTGANGASVSNLTLLGFNLDVEGGMGTSGLKKGGIGGSITGVTVENAGDIIASQMAFIAGDGGGVSSGTAAAGGNVLNLAMNSVNVVGTASPLAGLFVSAGDGGTATSSGKGGNGGYVLNARILDTTLGLFDGGAAYFGGNGGNGTSAGGNGGYVSKITLEGANVDTTVQGGNGGEGTNGNGGNGGGLSSLTINLSGTVGGLESSILVGAGNGGNSTGKGKAGYGGSLTANNGLRSPGNIAVAAGDGGINNFVAIPVLGTSGNGGSISNLLTVANGLTSSVDISAGDAGDATNALKGGVGGSLLTQVNVIANNNISVVAGDGSGGGAGGKINSLSIASQLAGNMPSGDVMVRAGDGSALGKTSGSGGSLNKITLYASGTNTNTTTIKAGDGGGGGSAIKGAAGGSINTVTILNGTDDGQITIWAGEGGDGTSGSGGLGGSITNVTVVDDTLVANVLAGDGGDVTVVGSKGKPGAGGSVTKVFSFGDLGYRTGKSYGFTATDLNDPNTWYGNMGGIFGGAGGTNSEVIPLEGKAGNVTTITANAIATIVAGKNLASPKLLSFVDQIILNGLANTPNATLAGDYTNWDSAVMIGGIAGDPTLPGANEFQTTAGAWTPASFWTLGVTQPIDGLVAALVFGKKFNSVPMAALTLNNISLATLAGARVPV